MRSRGGVMRFALLCMVLGGGCVLRTLPCGLGDGVSDVGFETVAAKPLPKGADVCSTHQRLAPRGMRQRETARLHASVSATASRRVASSASVSVCAALHLHPIDPRAPPLRGTPTRTRGARLALGRAAAGGPCEPSAHASRGGGGRTDAALLGAQVCRCAVGVTVGVGVGK